VAQGIAEPTREEEHGRMHFPTRCVEAKRVQIEQQEQQPISAQARRGGDKDEEARPG